VARYMRWNEGKNYVFSWQPKSIRILEEEEEEEGERKKERKKGLTKFHVFKYDILFGNHYYKTC
jgi:hypothetical protein